MVPMVQDRSGVKKKDKAAPGLATASSFQQQSLENVLRQLALEYDLLQNMGVGIRMIVEDLGPAGFRLELHEIALGLGNGRILGTQLGEHHDVIFALHGVLDTVVALGERDPANLNGVGESDLLHVGHAVLIKSRQAKNR